MSATAGGAERPKLVLVTGLSGSGKSTVAKALEDLGYHVVDNLPLPLLETFLADPVAQVGSRRRLAVVTDVRAAGFAEEAARLLELVDRRRYDVVLLFLEATEAALVRRFSETRRSHPLAEGGRSLVDGIRAEVALLADLRGSADLVFDTTDWSVHDVRAEVFRELGEAGRKQGTLTVSLTSFGFKHGPPAGSDLVFDVRFLPNPHFLPALRDQSGLDSAVVDYMEQQPDFGELVARLESLLLFLLPRYRAENRSYLTVAIGCTGGRHRSVAVCERLGRRLGERGWEVQRHHRDLAREGSRPTERP